MNKGMNMSSFKTVTGSEMGTNCYCLVKEKSILCIDFVPEVIPWIKENGYTVTDLLLTHIHYDHINGLATYQEECPEPFTLHLNSNASQTINDPNHNLLIMFPGEVWKNLPEISLDKSNIIKSGDIITWNETAIDVLESPGHADSCCMFIFHSLKTVVSGDTLFQGSIGRTDFPGGDFDLLKQSVDTLFALADNDYTVLPGHGPATTIGEEKRNNPFLK
jgi:hydroxyacylglutathione hydrolase